MCPKELKGVEKDIKATEIIIRYIDLPEDQYRIGRTKVDKKKIKRKSKKKMIQKNIFMCCIYKCQNNTPHYKKKHLKSNLIWFI